MKGCVFLNSDFRSDIVYNGWYKISNWLCSDWFSVRKIRC